ncbi:hypothetical protein BIW11_04835 [Tropilaelaps mercedesae]|uniref:Uncharacterized protein n=1 Tax=Tropilaelaps mercedesae TaxID=418985 RepID=A0A1V9X147_9ACAR|nr:hypothetical protein BIW11_04835 [Tropilaelaps mercedesae]
MRADRQEADG